MEKNKYLISEEKFDYTSLSSEEMDFFNKQQIEPVKNEVEAVLKSRKTIKKIIFRLGVALGTILTIKGVSAFLLKDCPPPQERTAESMEICPEPASEEYPCYEEENLLP